MRALPGVAPSSSNSTSASAFKSGTLVPAVADPIPDSVLAKPFIGEVRRFDGTTAPAGWMFAQGQSMPVADNSKLFSILGRRPGDRGTSTFNLPNPGFGVIVAVAGLYPTSPQVVALSGRHMTYLDSLGPGARPVAARMRLPSQKALAELKRLPATVRVGRTSALPVPRELANRYRAALDGARAAAIEALSPANRARLESAVQAAVSGRTSLYGAVTEMRSSLSAGEAEALLRVDDAMNRPFNDRWDESPAGRENVLGSAAGYLIGVAITPEQARAMFARERLSL